MSHNLPPDLSRLRSLLPELVAEARRSIPYASVLVTSRQGQVVVKATSDERVNPLAPDQGMRISVWDGATFHSLATNRLEDRDELVRLIRELARSVKVRPGPVPESGPAADRHSVSVGAKPPADYDVLVRKATCEQVYEGLMGIDPRITSAQVAYRWERESRLFCDGRQLLSSDISLVVLAVWVFAGQQNRQVSNFALLSGNGHEVADRATTAWAKETAEQAIAHLSAGRVPPGEHVVILDPNLAGTLAHESFGHGCELDTMMRGAARALHYIGRRVGSDLVNIVDFPGRPGCNGSVFFSDDGVLAEEPIVLVRNGILQPTMMCDRYSFLAMKDRLPGLKQSASGRLESWDHPIYARMTNTYFEPRPPELGGLTRDQMIADTDRGILLEQLISGMEDPLGWGVQLQIVRGREIERGRLTGRLYYQIGATGYVPDVLTSVDRVGTELNLESAGLCGKGHKELVRSATGGPFIRCRMRLG